MIPNPGPQTQAYFCEADELYYGGQAGGGKSGLLLGLALNEHQESLILRRVNDDAKELAEEAKGFAGEAGSYNGQDKCSASRTADQVRRVPVRGGQGAVQGPRQGLLRLRRGRRLLGEPVHLHHHLEPLEPPGPAVPRGGRRQPADEARRPVGSEALGRLARQAPPEIPDRAGRAALVHERRERRGDRGRGPGPHMVGGQEVFARSRTFIPAKLSDNPFLADTDYQASLDALPRICARPTATATSRPRSRMTCSSSSPPIGWWQRRPAGTRRGATGWQ